MDQKKSKLPGRIKQLLTSGCDERIKLSEVTHRNKYYLDPSEFEGLLHRGSCTCCTLTPETEELLVNTDVDHMDQYFEEVVASHANQIKDLLSIENGCRFEVFFAPSGSDLAYYPLLFQKILDPSGRIVNIVTCPEELGSGTILASEGRYYATLNQFGETVNKGERLDSNILPEMINLPGRDEDGFIHDNRSRLGQILQNVQSGATIVNLVYGSKSGIEDNLRVIDDLKDSDIMWTVDLCQFRNSKYLVNSLLSKGCLIYLTGSKFYQAPPFCGCLLVPEELCKKLSQATAEESVAFQGIFSKYDIPSFLVNIRSRLRPFKNLGLHLRWKCAIHEMYRFDNIEEQVTYGLIERWNSVVTERLAQSPYLELMPDMDRTNKSIISFRVKTHSGFWDYDDLSLFFQTLATKTFEDGDIKRVFIGQPVKYTNGSFLRLALGASNIIEMYESGQEDPFSKDMFLIGLIEKEIVRCLQE